VGKTLLFSCSYPNNIHQEALLFSVTLCSFATSSSSFLSTTFIINYYQFSSINQSSMSEATSTNVKCIFVPVFIPIFIPVVLPANSPSGEKKYVQQQPTPHQPQVGCTKLIGNGDESFELVTPPSANPDPYFGQCRRRVEGGGEPCFVLGKEHCVKRGLVAPVTHLVVDNQTSVSSEYHFFSRQMECAVQFLFSYLSSTTSSYRRYRSLCTTEQRFEMVFNSTKLSSSPCIGLPNPPVNPLPTPPTPNPTGVPRTLSSSPSSSCSSCSRRGLCCFDLRTCNVDSASDCNRDCWLLVSSISICLLLVQ
jgi:hypothetical protein